MLQEGYYVFTLNHPAVAAKLKVAGPIAYSLARTLSMAYEHSKVYVYFILKLLRISETATY